MARCGRQLPTRPLRGLCVWSGRTVVFALWVVRIARWLFLEYWFQHCSLGIAGTLHLFFWRHPSATFRDSGTFRTCRSPMAVLRGHRWERTGEAISDPLSAGLAVRQAASDHRHGARYPATGACPRRTVTPRQLWDDRNDDQTLDVSSACADRASWSVARSSSPIPTSSSTAAVTLRVTSRPGKEGSLSCPGE